jgi:hypothetical protein
MDQSQYSNLLEGTQAVPDPRHARGKQLEWSLLWGVIAGGLLSNHRTPAAIMQWARQHAALLLAVFRPARGRLPSESTIRRTLRQVDITALEAHLARVAAAPSSSPRLCRPSTPHRPPCHRSRGRPLMANISAASVPMASRWNW